MALPPPDLTAPPPVGRPWLGRGRKAPAPRSEPAIAPAITKVRDWLISIRTGRTRAATVAGKRLTRAEQKAANDIEYPDVQRPRTRGDCLEMDRPCPFVSCAHHLYLEPGGALGSVKLNFPHLEVEQMAHTCCLDLADLGGMTLEAVAEALNLTRERVRQIEVEGLAKARRNAAACKEAAL